MILFLRDGHRSHCPQRRVGRGVGGGIAAGRAIAVAGVIGWRGAALVEGEADGALAERSHHSDSQPQHGPKEYKISILSHKLMF